MSEASTHIIVAAVWGILVVISWLGLGSFVDRFLWRGFDGGEKRRAPLGLLTGWVRDRRLRCTQGFANSI